MQMDFINMARPHSQPSVHALMYVMLVSAQKPGVMLNIIGWDAFCPSEGYEWMMVSES